MRRRPRTSVVAGGITKTRILQKPLGIGVGQEQSFYYKDHGAVVHPFLGTQGIRIKGRQPFVKVSEVKGNYFALLPDIATVDDGVYGTLPPHAAGNYVVLTPLEMGGMLERYGQLYQKYVFRNIRFIYSTTTGTNTSVSFAMSVSHDPGVQAFSQPPTSYSAVRMVNPNCNTPIWDPQCVLNYHYKGMDTWFNDYATSNYLNDVDSATQSASDLILKDMMYRNSGQALFAGYLNRIGGGSDILYGFIDIEYDIEFYYPVFATLTHLVDSTPTSAALEDSKVGSKFSKSFLRGLKTEKKEERKGLLSTDSRDSTLLRAMPILEEEVFESPVPVEKPA